LAPTDGGEKVGGIRQVSLTAAGFFSRLAAQMGTVSDCDTALTRWVIDDLVEVPTPGMSRRSTAKSLPRRSMLTTWSTS
jgi:hypothetical protein